MRNYTTVFWWYCSDRKRAGVFAYPSGATSDKKAEIRIFAAYYIDKRTKKCYTIR